MPNIPRPLRLLGRRRVLRIRGSLRILRILRTLRILEIFFSVALTRVTIKRCSVEGGFRNVPDGVDPDDRDNDDPTTRKAAQFDSEVIVVMDRQVAC